MNHEIRNIIAGISENTTGNLIKSTLFFLRKSTTASRKIEKTELIYKENEVRELEFFANQNQLWYNNIDENTFIGEGAEQKVYLNADGKSVLKINDTIFYESWEDYFISLLIHNFLFPSTAYEFIGFYKKETILYAVVKQSFIESTESTDLLKLKIFLKKNGFEHKKNNDYFNNELGVILEDLHDENVLTNRGVFFFIDSAIYLIK